MCTDCGCCESVCPMLVAPRRTNMPKVYAAWNRDDGIRTHSSSGGVFNALLTRTLQQGGVVFGAAFDESLNLRHQFVNKTKESPKLRGSKYLQSIIGDTYQMVRHFLNQGRPVLFSGTPCQIAGLYTFLPRDHDNLLTCDVVCHGVPSPGVFDAYRQTLERRYGGKTQRIDFRYQDNGWKRYSIRISFENGVTHCRILSEDPFMIGFLKNICLRPCCHTCRFSRLPRVADISLGDFWGVGKHHPEWDDDQGTSVVLVQTEKGQNAMDECVGDLVVHGADLDSAVQANPCICGSVAPHRQRNAFFHALNRHPFEKVMKTYLSPPNQWKKALVNMKKKALGKGRGL